MLCPGPGTPFKAPLQPHPSQPCFPGPPSWGARAFIARGPSWGPGAENVVPPLRWRKGWPWGKRPSGQQSKRAGAFEEWKRALPPAPFPHIAGTWGVKGVAGGWWGRAQPGSHCLPEAACSPAPHRGQRRPCCRPRWPGAGRWSCSSSGSYAPAGRRRAPHCCRSTRRRGLPRDRTLDRVLLPRAGPVPLPPPPDADPAGWATLPCAHLTGGRPCQACMRCGC